MLMKHSLVRIFAFVAFIVSSSLANAQVPVGPFAPSAPIANNFERFDSIPPGTYAAVTIMSGGGVVARFSTGGLLVIDNAILPAFSSPSCLWGRDTPVEYRLVQTKRWFGGYFRVPNVGVPTSSVIIRFYQGMTLVGVAVAPVNTSAWQWRGWFVSQGFNRLVVSGNNASGGYVGMDDVRVRN
jgi:hypothetical protein